MVVLSFSVTPFDCASNQLTVRTKGEKAKFSTPLSAAVSATKPTKVAKLSGIASVNWNPCTLSKWSTFTGTLMVLSVRVTPLVSTKKVSESTLAGGRIMVSVPNMTLNTQESITFLEVVSVSMYLMRVVPTASVSPGLRLLLRTATVLSHPLLKIGAFQVTTALVLPAGATVMTSVGHSVKPAVWVLSISTTIAVRSLLAHFLPEESMASTYKVSALVGLKLRVSLANGVPPVGTSYQLTVKAESAFTFITGKVLTEHALMRPASICGLGEAEPITMVSMPSQPPVVSLTDTV